jgi:hypothetical protein
MPNALLAGLCGIGLLLVSSIARADCIENPRTIELAKNNVFRLKSYRCGMGADDVQVRVEFHRFADLPASLIVGKASSSLLTKTIGSPKVIENDVYKSFADLLNRFGSTSEDLRRMKFGTETEASFALGDSGQQATDKIRANKVRTLGHLFNVTANRLSFPAASEITSLKAKTIPDNLHYYYSINCNNEGKRSSAEVCTKILSNQKTFWRGMTSEDLANYSSNVLTYNQMLTLAKNRDSQLKNAIPNELKLMQYLAGNDWPSDFMILVGNYSTEACGEGAPPPGVGGWEFEAWQRNIFMDGVLIENMSKSPIKVDSLLGTRLSTPRLRVFDYLAPAESKGEVETLSETVAPGQRLLIPTRIGFAPSDDLKNDFAYAQTAAEVHRRLGSGGLRGNTAAFGAPTLKNYVYGTELVVSGLVANGKSVLLDQRPSNFIDMTVASLIGSCPYLLSWDNGEKEWIEHGKVLHKANGRNSEYTETVQLSGYRPRFRIEEREPELAFLDQVEMVVVLTNGAEAVLRPNDLRLADRDGDYLRLPWGDAAEIEFALPDWVSAADVTESRLTVTGYYERYSDLPVASDRAHAWHVRHTGNYTPIPPPTAAPQTCPAP